MSTALKVLAAAMLAAFDPGIAAAIGMTLVTAIYVEIQKLKGYEHMGEPATWLVGSGAIALAYTWECLATAGGWEGPVSLTEALGKFGLAVLAGTMLYHPSVKPMRFAMAAGCAFALGVLAGFPWLVVAMLPMFSVGATPGVTTTMVVGNVHALVWVAVRGVEEDEEVDGTMTYLLETYQHFWIYSGCVAAMVCARKVFGECVGEQARYQWTVSRRSSRS